MDKHALKHAQREFDRFLRSVPDRLREIFETVNYDAALQKFKNARDPAPDWVASQVRSLRVKTRTIRAAVSDLAEALESRLTQYTEAGGDDPTRIAHARSELLFLQKTLDEQAARAAQLQQIGQSASLLREQEELLDSLAVEQLRQRIEQAENAQQRGERHEE